MRKVLLPVLILLATSTSGLATMPPLTEKPHKRTDENCWAWAEKQAGDEEVAYMWGILDTGNSDPEVAVRRLAESCLGKPTPEIVGFGSSVGFDDSYCRRYPRQMI